MRMRDEGITPSPEGRMTVSFSLDDFRSFIEAMNAQLARAHTLGQEQATQQFGQVTQQIVEFLASVFREGQQCHDHAGRLHQENVALRSTVTAREQQERLDRIQLEVRLASVAASAEKEPKI